MKYFNAIVAAIFSVIASHAGRSIEYAIFLSAFLIICAMIVISEEHKK